MMPNSGQAVPQHSMYTVPVQVQNHNGQPFLVQSATTGSSSKVVKNYQGNTSKILGIIQIICGALTVLTGIPLTIGKLQCWGYFGVGYGIWTGVFFILGGSFALAAGTKKYKCLVITNLVMSIIACIFAAILLIFGIIDIVLLAVDNVYGDAYISSAPPAIGRKALLVLACILVLCGLVEMVASICSSVLPCKATCCNSDPEETIVVKYTMMDAAGAGSSQLPASVCLETLGARGQLAFIDDKGKGIPGQSMYPPRYMHGPEIPAYTTHPTVDSYVGLDDKQVLVDA